MSSSEDYEYDYSDQDSGSDAGSGESDDDPWIPVENAFYEGDDLIKESPQESLEKFKECISLEEALGEFKWRMKARTQLVILLYRMERFEEMKSVYQDLLGTIDKVGSNESTDSINKILDAVSNSTNKEMVAEVFDLTLDVLKGSKHQRMWFSCNLKLGKLLLSMHEQKGGSVQSASISRIRTIVQQLHDWCKLENGEDDVGKGSQLLEMYALKIQLCTATNDTAALKTIYPHTLQVRPSWL